MNRSTQRKRFEKVASNRVQKILDFLDLLENCANRSNYEYTEEDVELMFSEIQKSLKNAKDAFSKELNKSKKNEFSFK